ncbi:MAG: hypothetical protein C0485_18450 [Pirellula sp.]|nr:hypothetical protein [Pirellula sp.]
MNLIRISTLTSLTFLVVVALATPAHATPAQLYRVSDLGALPGATSTSAHAINDLGCVAGISGQSAFLWSPQSGMVNLGIPSTYLSATGVGINNSNQIAVSTTKGPNGSYQGHAFRWTNGVYEDLGTLGGSYSTAYGIDELGRVAGFAYSPSAIHAYRSTTGTTLIDIDGLGGDYSLGYGINASGHVVGQAYGSDGKYHAFFWPGSGPMQDLGLFGAAQSVAKDISDNGIILGGGDTAFIWQDGVTTSFSTPNFPGAFGSAVNNAGQVIGYYTYNQDYSRPFVWDAVNGAADLNTVLDPVTGAGWLLLYAYDLNNSGQIVGQGFHNGEVRAFVLTPIPEPTALLLLASGTAVCMQRHRRLCQSALSR